MGDIFDTAKQMTYFLKICPPKNNHYRRKIKKSVYFMQYFQGKNMVTC